MCATWECTYVEKSIHIRPIGNAKCTQHQKCISQHSANKNVHNARMGTHNARMPNQVGVAILVASRMEMHAVKCTCLICAFNSASNFSMLRSNAMESQHARAQCMDTHHRPAQKHGHTSQTNSHMDTHYKTAHGHTCLVRTFVLPI